MATLIDRAMDQGNFDIAKNRIGKHTDLTYKEETDLIAILDGTY